MAEAVIYGIFAFNNPDLKANQGIHCWVEPDRVFEPVPLGQNHTANAVDGSQIMLNVIKAQFFVSASMCGLIAVIMLIIILRYCSKDDIGPNDLVQYGCLVFAGLLFLIVGVFGSLIVDIWMNMIRVQHVVRVCSGDFLLGKSVGRFPYMQSSGKLLWYATTGKGLNS